MKRLLLSAILGLALVLAAGASLPTTVEELKERHAAQASTPEAALKLWFDSVFATMNRETGEEGAAMLGYLTIPYKDSPQWYRQSSARTFVERIKERPHIFRSYAKGSSPTNGYAMDPNNYELEVVSCMADSSGRGWAVVIRSSGADSPRPVYLKKSDQTGLYYVDTFSNVYVDVRPPVDPQKETFR